MVAAHLDHEFVAQVVCPLGQGADELVTVHLKHAQAQYLHTESPSSTKSAVSAGEPLDKRPPSPQLARATLLVTSLGLNQQTRQESRKTSPQTPHS